VKGSKKSEERAQNILSSKGLSLTTNSPVPQKKQQIKEGSVGGKRKGKKPRRLVAWTKDVLYAVQTETSASKPPFIHMQPDEIKKKLKA
jgi:hypothetical protein